MNKNEFSELMKTTKKVELGSELFEMFHILADDAIKITMELNNKYHTKEEIVEIFSKLTNKKVDPTFRLFPPFYTDCGVNISLGKNVFINSNCKFQDQGGITIGDNVLIGHNVVIATINHDLNPKKRADMYLKPVKIGNNVWIGSNVVILGGVTIEEGAVIGAGSIVTKDVPKNAVAFGSPCKVHKFIEGEN